MILSNIEREVIAHLFDAAPAQQLEPFFNRMAGKTELHKKLEEFLLADQPKTIADFENWLQKIPET